MLKTKIHENNKLTVSMSMRKIVISLISTVIAVLCCGCGSSSTNEKTPPPIEPLTIKFSTDYIKGQLPNGWSFEANSEYPNYAKIQTSDFSSIYIITKYTTTSDPNEEITSFINAYKKFKPTQMTKLSLGKNEFIKTTYTTHSETDKIAILKIKKGNFLTTFEYKDGSQYEAPDNNLYRVLSSIEFLTNAKKQKIDLLYDGMEYLVRQAPAEMTWFSSVTAQREAIKKMKGLPEDMLNYLSNKIDQEYETMDFDLWNEIEDERKKIDDIENNYSIDYYATHDVFIDSYTLYNNAFNNLKNIEKTKKYIDSNDCINTIIKMLRNGEDKSGIKLFNGEKNEPNKFKTNLENSVYESKKLFEK
ncbi:MAG TPA: hypothetical protein PK835_08325 [Caldisericia bacterium]|nr:hypothetical protein [Caldisericia bacterium]HOU09015.1 hypothetical protein [Caldisericia bacterium]